MRLFASYLSVLLLLLTVAGCSDGGKRDAAPSGVVAQQATNTTSSTVQNAQKKKAKKPKSPFAIDNLPTNTVVITVNGQGITQQEYADWLRVKSKLVLLQKKKKAKKFDLVAFTKSVIENRPRIHGELIRCSMVRQYAEANGLKPAAEEVAQARKGLDGLWSRAKTAFPPPPAAEAARDEGVIARIAYMSALDDVCLRHVATNDLTRVTDVELDAQLKRIEEWNRTADKKDAESREKAKKAKAEILAGAYFADVAKKYAEVAPDEGAEWETFELGEFQADEPIAQWLVTAKQGDVSDPIEMDDGYAIIGVRRILEGELEEEDGRRSKQYELVRCTFFAYEKIDPPTDREQFRKDILAARRQTTFEAFGMKLMDAYKVEYPRGTAIFEVAKKKKKKSARQKAPASAYLNRVKGADRDIH